MWRMCLVCAVALLAGAEGAGKNRNSLILIGQQLYFLRELSQETSYEERKAEWQIAQTTGSSGIGPEVVMGGPNWFVMNYVLGRHPRFRELAKSDNQGPFLRTLRLLHKSKIDLPKAKNIQEEIQQVAAQVPLNTLGQHALEQAQKLLIPPGAAVPLHGDLNPWNIFLSGNQAKLIDWTDARLGNPLSDLGYFALMNCLTRPETEKLLANYLERNLTVSEANAIWNWRLLHKLLLGLKLFARQPTTQDPMLESFCSWVASHEETGPTGDLGPIGLRLIREFLLESQD